MQLTLALHRAYRLYPDRVATVFGQRRRTYAQVHDRVGRAAAGLVALGVHADDRVGVLALNSDRYYELLFAVPWAGGVVVPFNTRWTVDEVAYAINDSGSTVLLVDDAFADVGGVLRQRCPDLAEVVFCGDDEPPADTLDYEQMVATHAAAEDVRRSGQDLFGVFYTGGTTAFSKGVMLSHHNVLASAYAGQATTEMVTPTGALLHVAPMFHLADICMWAVGGLQGSTNVILPRFDPTEVWATLAEHGVDDALLVPTMVQALVDAPRTSGAGGSGLRHLIYGASPMPERVLEAARSLFPHTDFVQAYGMTELAPLATMLTPADHDNPPRRRSAGRAVTNVEVTVIDPENGETLPAGSVGEVVVRGDNVMVGYWNRPQETADAVRDGWMRTGDLGYLDEHGYLFLVDRLKDMVISGGENVFSAAVEYELNKHEAVAASAVIGIPDDEWGEAVHAVVVLHPGAIAEADDLRAFCRDRMAGYKVPRTVEFVDSLPMSGAGKVLKRVLREPYWEGTARQI